MADRIADTLPRLADALLEVGTRLGEISAELHALAPPGLATQATETPATTTTSGLTEAGHPAPANAGWLVPGQAEPTVEAQAAASATHSLAEHPPAESALRSDQPGGATRSANLGAQPAESAADLADPTHSAVPGTTPPAAPARSADAPHPAAIAHLAGEPVSGPVPTDAESPTGATFPAAPPSTAHSAGPTLGAQTASHPGSATGPVVPDPANAAESADAGHPATGTYAASPPGSAADPFAAEPSIPDHRPGAATGPGSPADPSAPGHRPAVTQPGAAVDPFAAGPSAHYPAAGQPGSTPADPTLAAASSTGPFPQSPTGWGTPPPSGYYPASPGHQGQPVWHEPPEPPRSTLWEWLSRDGAGSRILAWAGGVVTLAGVVLLLILAIQRGYLGPLPRVLLGVGLGLTLAGIGAWLHRNPTARTGAYALAATGSAVLYLDVVAATSLYGFLPTWGGLLAGLAVTAGGIALAGVWDSEVFAVFMVVCCAVSAPIITQGFDALLLSFLLVLLLATTPVQLAKHWYGLMIAAALPPIVVSLVNVDMDRGATTTAILAGITSVVIGALATITAMRRPGDQFTLVMLCLAPVPGMFAAIQLPRVGASILPAAIGVLLLLVWLLGYLTTLPRTFALSAGGLASLALLQATATAFDGDARAIAFLAETLVITMLAVRLRLKIALLPAALFATVGLCFGLVEAAGPDLLVRPHRIDIAGAVTLGLTGALIAAVAIILCWAGFRLAVLPGGEHAPHGWVPAGLLALYGSTATLLSVGLLIFQDRDGFLLGHVFVTVSWTVAALVLLLRGIDSVPLRVAGLSLVVAALAKLVLFDLSSLDGMARVMAFLVAGLVLLAAGARYARLVAIRARS